MQGNRHGKRGMREWYGPILLFFLLLLLLLLLLLFSPVLLLPCTYAFMYLCVSHLLFIVSSPMTVVNVDDSSNVSLVPTHAMPHPEDPGMKSRTANRNSAIFWSFVAGAVTGGSEALFTYPVEYVKTNLQLQQLASPTAATPHQYRGMWDCVKRTVQEYSPLGLYRGFIPVLLGSIPKQAFRWTAYEWATGRAKLMMMHGGNAQSERGVVTLSLPTVSACGFFAGCVEAVFVVGPTESVKTRLIQDAKQTCPRYRPLGTARAVRLMLQENGVRRTFYSGVGATMLKQGLNQALRFPTQEFVMDVICCSNTKNNIIGSRNGGSSPFAMRQHEERRHSPFWNGVAGFCAGFISVLVTQPVDVVKTHLQSGAAHNATAVHTCGIGKKPSCVGFFRCLRAIYCQRGVAGLYSGFIARSVHVGIHVALTFTVFPVVKRFFLTSAA